MKIEHYKNEKGVDTTKFIYTKEEVEEMKKRYEEHKKLKELKK